MAEQIYLKHLGVVNPDWLVEYERSLVLHNDKMEALLRTEDGLALIFTWLRTGKRDMLLHAKKTEAFRSKEIREAVLGLSDDDLLLLVKLIPETVLYAAGSDQERRFIWFAAILGKTIALHNAKEIGMFERWDVAEALLGERSWLFHMPLRSAEWFLRVFRGTLADKLERFILNLPVGRDYFPEGVASLLANHYARSRQTIDRLLIETIYTFDRVEADIRGDCAAFVCGGQLANLPPLQVNSQLMPLIYEYLSPDFQDWPMWVKGEGRGVTPEGRRKLAMLERCFQNLAWMTEHYIKMYGKARTYEAYRQREPQFENNPLIVERLLSSYAAVKKTKAMDMTKMPEYRIGRGVWPT